MRPIWPALADQTRERMGATPDQAEAAGDMRSAVQAGRRMIAALETMGKLRGEIDSNATVNIIASPIVLGPQQVVLDAHAPFPAARAAVAQATAGIAGPPTIDAAEMLLLQSRSPLRLR